MVFHCPRKQAPCSVGKNHYRVVGTHNTKKFQIPVQDDQVLEMEPSRYLLPHAGRKSLLANGGSASVLSNKLAKFRRKNQIKNERTDSEMNFEYFHRQNQGF